MDDKDKKRLISLFGWELEKHPSHGETMIRRGNNFPGLCINTLELKDYNPDENILYFFEIWNRLYFKDKNEVLESVGCSRNVIDFMDMINEDLPRIMKAVMEEME